MNKRIIEAFRNNPIIPSVKNENDLDEALKTDNEIIFIITSNLINISDLVARIKDSEKLAFVHIDLVDGLGTSTYALDYLLNLTQADGIITTKTGLIRAAKARDVFVIKRFFIFDSISINSGIKAIKEHAPDAVEILPGLMPRVIEKFSNITSIPVIVGGLIESREDIMTALKSGACSVSSNRHNTWIM